MADEKFEKAVNALIENNKNKRKIVVSMAKAAVKDNFSSMTLNKVKLPVKEGLH